jgi:hypothetical protein
MKKGRFKNPDGSSCGLSVIWPAWASRHFCGLSPGHKAPHRCRCGCGIETAR